MSSSMPPEITAATAAGTISRFEGSNLPIPQDPKCYLAEFEDAVGKPTLNSEFFGYTACLC